MPKPQIIIGGAEGLHNASRDATDRIERGQMYRDVSTVLVVPTRGTVPARVVDSWMNLLTPMNHPFVRMFVEGLEVGAAYNQAVSTILAHPQLKDFRYMLTMEEDNLPPPDGLLKLLESIDGHAAVGGLYWTKGELGQPMIYGEPGRVPMFAPQKPIADTLQPCNGLGMGFTLFDLSVFKEIDPPWFVTLQEWKPGEGVKMATQDLYAFEQIRNAGHKVACDTRVRVGHLDSEGVIW